MNNPIKFSNQNRSSRLTAASKEQHDLIIIGGGITGAGIALDASLRGLKTILLEKGDFASGTSSKSTKLIHGGLRYLKQFEIKLVRESGLERAIAHENACHLVHPESMFLPIVKNGSFGKLTASFAVSVYDWLASVPAKDRKQVLSKEESLERETLLRSDILKSGILYSEYRTDDARLTIELIKKAREQSAEAFNYLEVKSFLENNGKLGGVVAYDKVLDKEVQISARVIVNATGPWADSLRRVDDSSSQTNLRLTKGVHVVIAKEKLNLKSATYFDAFDGRMIFAIPRGRCVYIGTTDTKFTEDNNEVHCNEEDAQYLLDAVNRFFDISDLSIADIESTWAGLRPLIHQFGKPPTEISRKDEIFISNRKLITIAGGKLTGFRKMAERVMRIVFEQLGEKETASKTIDHKIHINPFEDYSAFQVFCKNIQTKYQGYPLSQDLLLEAVHNFGKDIVYILNQTDINASRSIKENDEALIVGLVNYAVEFESCFHTLDFIERRTGWLYFNIELAKTNIDLVTDKIGEHLNLSAEDLEKMKVASYEALENHSLERIKRSIS